MPLTPNSAVSEIEIGAPPARVFEALTDPRQILAWWGEEPSVELIVCEMDARLGGLWRFHWRPQAGAAPSEAREQLERNGARVFEAHGQILEFEPPTLLVWSWIANWHQHPDRPTVVRWELTPIPSGTRVRVIHGALADEPAARDEYAGGWVGVLQLLRSHCES
jgi:uncharacterized protein YndB with AHSA1/START domain